MAFATSSKESLGRLESPSTIKLSADELFTNIESTSTRSAFLARQSVKGVFCEHRLTVRDQSHHVKFVHRTAPLCSLTFNLIGYGADVEVVVNQVNRSHYIVVIPLSGRALVQNHQTDATLDVGKLVMLDPLRRFRFNMDKDHRHLAVGIPRDRLNRVFSKYSGQLPQDWIEFQHKPYLLNDTTSFIELLEYVCGEIDRPLSSTQQWMVASSIEEALLTTLVSALLGETANAPYSEDLVSAMPECIRNAMDFMEANLVEEIGAQDIADAAGVPLRTFYDICKKYRGTSPKRWLKIQRLHRARSDLLDPEQCNDSVTDIALRYHQHHLGRFAKAYFEEFGEYPSDTRSSRSSGSLRSAC